MCMNECLTTANYFKHKMTHLRRTIDHKGGVQSNVKYTLGILVVEI